MVLYKCENCLKEFNKKSNYLMHIEHRKTPCSKSPELMAPNLQKAQKVAPNSNYGPVFVEKHEYLNNITNNNKNKDTICTYCNKSFVKVYGLNRHLKICKEKQNIIDELLMENEKLKYEQKIKDEEIEKLKNEKKNNNNNNTNNTINTINNTNNNIINNNNIQINILNYGEEDLSKLDMEKILKYDNAFIEMVFRDIHCNPEIPENQNILLPSLSRYDIYVKLNNEWLKRNKNEILKERYDSIRGYLMDLYIEESEKNKKNADKMYFHFLKQIKQVDPTTAIYKPQEEKKIIEGIANVLYNHKDNIKSVDKNPLIPKIRKQPNNIVK